MNNTLSIKPNKTYNMIHKFPLKKFTDWLEEICNQQNWFVEYEFIGVKGVQITFKPKL